MQRARRSCPSRGSRAVMLAVLLTAAACGRGGGGTPDHPAEPDDRAGASISAGPLPMDPPPGTPRQVARQMRAWQNFPVERPVRPIVLTGAVAHEPDDYIRAVSLAFTDPTHLPTGPTELGGYPVIEARQALGTLHELAAHHPRTRRRVEVTSMRVRTGTFWTDRGLQQLPAWQVTYKPRGGGPDTPAATAIVLALPPDAWYQGTVGKSTVGVAPDGLALLVPYHGSNCEKYGFLADALETRTSLAFRIRSLGVLGGPACAGSAATHIIRVPLAHPLGDRIVLNEDLNGENHPTYSALPCGTTAWKPVEVPPCKPTDYVHGPVPPARPL